MEQGIVLGSLEFDLAMSAEKELEDSKHAEEMRKLRKAKKEKLVEGVIDDIFTDIYENRKYIKELCREALRTRTNKDLISIVKGN
jgi:hypothetical protein